MTLWLLWRAGWFLGLGWWRHSRDGWRRIRPGWNWWMSCYRIYWRLSVHRRRTPPRLLLRVRVVSIWRGRAKRKTQSGLPAEGTIYTSDGRSETSQSASPRTRSTAADKVLRRPPKTRNECQPKERCRTAEPPRPPSVVECQ